MRSHLTRQVFRRILSDESYFLSRCATSPARSFARHYAPQQFRLPPRRGFFGSARPSDRKLKDAEFDPGLQKMVEFSNLSKLGARPPPIPELVKAFKLFFSSKSGVHASVQEIQAIHAMRTFKYLIEQDSTSGRSGLELVDIEKALVALSRPVGSKTRGAHDELAKLLFTEARSREGFLAEQSKYPRLIPKYVQVLCNSGESIEARTLIHELEGDLPEDVIKKLWVAVLQGLSSEKNDEQVRQTFSALEKSGVPFDSKLHQIMTLHFAHQDKIEEAKLWYKRPIVNDGTPAYATNYGVLRMCLRTSEFELGDSMFHSVLEGNMSKASWDTIFQWAAARGKGVDEVEQMMEVMVRRNEGRTKVRPDIETINRLIELVNSKENSYLAERYVALAERWKMVPNAKTYLLQMEYRLRVDDLAGAKAAYNKLQGTEISEGEDLPQINALIRALCARTEPDQDVISELVEDLSQRNVRFEPNTVSSLCLNHLRRQEIHDVHDLLQTHIYHYSLEQRAEIYNVFVDYCLDRKNSTARAWDSYNIIYVVFDEVPSPTRTRLMNDFFDRGRADMACHVFGHMRQHLRPEHRPTHDTYVACFEGIARAGDAESLDMVHNMMKLDSTIEPSTRLLNVLMLAYAACEEPYRSLEFWRDIINSKEGPSYNSVQIALRACETVPFGDKYAREIWELLNSMKVEITKEVYDAYVSALAGAFQLEEAKESVDRMEETIGQVPDAVTIGSMYNAISMQQSNDELSLWARKLYPAAWKQLEEIGTKRAGLRRRVFKIERQLKP
ncbi:MAG: hypothetical protein M4579_006257 [Chaenotheca gracillima]|nr:MAG: hypothetical protein M4579_006257 [Chaenotheca gracillima]